MRSPPDWHAALADWLEIVGPERVDISDQALARAVEATFPIDRRVIAILRPADADQVARCVAVAATRRTPIHPVSCGCNWGLGSLVPSAAESALVDLGDLKRLGPLDDELGTIRVEPGVSFGDLASFLRQQGGRWFSNVVGVGPSASVLANALERGHGYGPAADRVASIVALDVVLADGSRVRTGYSRFNGAHVGNAGRWGVGPWIDGLFHQSNLGVVVGATVHLSRVPAAFGAAAWTVDSEEGLAPLVDGLRELRQVGVLKGNIAIWNTDKLLTSLTRFPHHITSTPLPEELRLEAARRRGCWMGWTGLYAAGTDELEAHTRRLVDHLSTSASRVSVVASDGGVLHGAEWPEEARAASLLASPHTSPFLGHPPMGALASAYWRKRPEVDVGNPDRDRCGLRWCSAALPFVGRHVRAAVDEAVRVAVRHELEAPVSLISTGDRQVDLMLALTYDREVAEDEERATGAAVEFHARMRELGYPAQRLGVDSMSALESGDGWDQLAWRLKRILDPANVISPGRYQVSEGAQ